MLYRKKRDSQLKSILIDSSEQVESESEYMSSEEEEEEQEKTEEIKMNAEEDI
jgi:hypothetical protein